MIHLAQKSKWSFIFRVKDVPMLRPADSFMLKDDDSHQDQLTKSGAV